MNPTSKCSRSKVLILVAPEFDEVSTLECLCQIRQERVTVALVGKLAGALTGLHGAIIEPDISLSRLLAWPPPDAQLLIIPDGDSSVASLLSDPRVHRLITAVLNRGGFVVTISPLVHQMLVTVGIWTPERASHFLSRSNGDSSQFFAKLLAMLPS